MTLWPLATAGAILLAAVWAGHGALRAWLVTQRAIRLRAQAKPIVDRRLEHLDGQLELPQLAAILAVDLTSRDTTALVLGPEGEILGAPALDQTELRVPQVAPERRRRAFDGDPHVTWVTRDDQNRRVLVALIPPKRWLPEPPAVIALATDLSDDERLLRRLGAAVAAAVLAVSWLAVALEWLAGGALDLLALLALPVAALVVRAVAGARPSPLEDRSPAPRAAAGATHADFTEAMRRVEAAFLAQRASEDRMRRFVADASHELRTPLTSLSGAAEVLLRGAKDDPAHVERVARVLQAQSGRMRRLVEDLLTLARLDAGTELHPRALALDELARDHAEELELAAPGRTVSVEATSGTVVRGDPERLRQVLANLTGNAVRHTREHGLVQITVTHDDGCAALCVRDDGDGIAPEDLPRVFERFFRADSDRNSDGSGLGLAIVREIVEAHNGSVTASGAPGKGAEFTVRLPLAGSAELQQAGSHATGRAETITT